MWSSINDKASEVLSGCVTRLELAKDKLTKIVGDYKEDMNALTSITMVGRASISNDSPSSDDVPVAAETATESDLYEVTVEKYDKVIELTKGNIE